jgi:simple sugar transport system ATP-binding protein
MMVGRSVRTQFDKTATSATAPVLEVEHLRVADQYGVVRVDDVSFRVNVGEIVGIAGVAGNGQSELLEAITGMREASGRVSLLGKSLALDKPNSYVLRERGLAHVPEDRQGMGLVVPFKAQENIILGHHRSADYTRGCRLDHRAINRDTRDKMNHFDVRPQDPYLRTALFSGGNQQKLVLAREMEQNPQLLVVGQPTRGVDIGAVEFIHQRLVDMRNDGKAVLMVSVDLDEILRLADRILVMFDGKIVGETSASASRAELGLLMAGAGTA